MKPYLLYVIGIIVLVVLLATCLQFHLPFTSLAVGVTLLCLCLSLYGRISRLLFAYRETERENATLHQRLTEGERQTQYLRQLTENVDTALFICTTDGRIDWMNQAGKEIVGTGLFLPPHLLSAIANHEEVVDGCALSTVLLRIDGRQRLIVTMKDVSLLMQRQEMEAWQQLIRVLTHEIMNSLTPIISISETLAPYTSPVGDEQGSSLQMPPAGGLRGATPSTAETQEAFAVINHRCRSLLAFVESYRQLTRIKEPSPTEFPVHELFEEAKILYPQIKTDDEEAVLFADRSQIEQVLINLIKNAYESGATEVEVTANDCGTICVKDNGSGMTSDVLSHIFIPFFTTKPSGSGIGLSLCRQIILKHGGTISADSTPGQGTTFTIQL